MPHEDSLPVAPSNDRGSAAYAACLTPPPQPGEPWAAAVPDLPGCLSTGDGVRECMANISDAVEAWFVAALREGRAAPEPTPIDDLARQPVHAGALWLRIDRRRPEPVAAPLTLAASVPLSADGAIPDVLQPALPALPQDAGESTL
ncbi:type II toxin-antitoxin system HicB family antitoxin [Ideonella sp. BN130291]|uniref:type II toxin-antitoxin system HicB family antitoxin n=1 Tax=Ideonella sp. BN130291 TaxID=3112940 RepID=UPI002E264D20|nr:type II toxin-antitoxin system HicB family antitoxin [Ideonella sp. BN130291]